MNRNTRAVIAGALVLSAALIGIGLCLWGNRVTPVDELYAAAREGDIQLATVALQEGADVNAPGENGGDSPLTAAAGNGHLPMVEFLLKHGANPLLKDYDGHSAWAVAGDKTIKTVLRAAIDRALARQGSSRRSSGNHQSSQVRYYN